VPDVNAFPEPARVAILDWYATHRRALPFRETTDPYAILVSEAMAQQTQAQRAGEAWTRFMAAFPSPAALAAALPSDVLRAWRGLGYNRRALSLWRAARRIVEVHSGRVPADVRALEALPGVGPYTARAVAAIAFGMPVGAVDTNVRRVLGRIVAGDPVALGAATLQALADAAVSPARPGDWTHAVMDLGATVCSPRLPDCDVCPARPWCRYAAARPTSVAAGAAPLAAGEASRAWAVRDAAPPFVRTNRWLRGRIVDRLRAVAGDGWLVIDAPIGAHDRQAVAAALEGLARDGLIELDPRSSSGGRRARLSVA
jgi:A/G-specific adenine glycosylase